MKEVEDIYLRALIEKKKAWDPKHKRALDTIYNLKLLYKIRFMFENAI